MEIIPKKSLGQNFLRDEKALGKIIQAAELSANDLVLEIGPGEGVLTEELIKNAEKVICIEKDEALAERLAKNLQFTIYNFPILPSASRGGQTISNDSSLNFQNKGAVIAGDILRVNLPKIIKENNFQSYKLVANIPYYITGQIIRLFLETEIAPKLMVLLVQKEVAERICAQPGQLSILALSVQYYGQPEIVDYVGKESFYPVPEVDSAILKVKITGKYQPEDKQFFKLVRMGFSSKRKTLVNNLSAGLTKNKEELISVIKSLGLDENVRAQELSLEQWKSLVKALEK